MGKANRGGQKRKEAPARKQLQGRGGNSMLLHKNNHRQHGGAHKAAGLEGKGEEGSRERERERERERAQKTGRGEEKDKCAWWFDSGFMECRDRFLSNFS